MRHKDRQSKSHLTSGQDMLFYLIVSLQELLTTIFWNKIRAKEQRLFSKVYVDTIQLDLKRHILLVKQTMTFVTKAIKGIYYYE